MDAHTPSNLQIVESYVRSEYSYEAVEDPMTVVQIEEVNAVGDKGQQPGDFFLRDEVTGNIVRVVYGAVQTVWRNW